MPIATAGDEVIGYQAQCRAGDWNSITHNHREHAVEDAELHKRYYHHNISIVAVTHGE